jgi:hypothetical protein
MVVDVDPNLGIASENAASPQIDEVQQSRRDHPVLGGCGRGQRVNVHVRQPISGVELFFGFEV